MLKKQRVIYLICLLGLALSLGACAGMKEKRKTPEKLYEEGIKALEGRKALFLFHVTDFEGAENAFREIKSRYSFTTYAPLAELRLADIHFRKKEYNEAIAAYEDFIKLHPDHDERPYARHRLGLSYFNQITTADRDQTATEGALIQFQALMDAYPESEYAKEAAEKIESCKTTLSLHEYTVGYFYYKSKNYEAAVPRFKEALERFPGYGPKEDAMLYLGLSQIRNGDVEQGRGTMERLIEAFPKSHQAEEGRDSLETNN
ncbi:MAG: outer membrane protein assembly factor BamD [Proteobacteria bacterium]|nr:outer membrane protein assembly factor BamD [Pseudomonadota bacterium]